MCIFNFTTGHKQKLDHILSNYKRELDNIKRKKNDKKNIKVQTHNQQYTPNYTQNDAEA